MGDWGRGRSHHPQGDHEQRWKLSFLLIFSKNLHDQLPFLG